MIENRNQYSKHDIYRVGELMSREFRRLGCDVKKIGKILQVNNNWKTCYLLETETSFTSLLAYRILKDKNLARKVLQNIGLNVAVGHSYKLNDQEAAFRKLKEIGLAVVKPVDGNKGIGVSVKVTAETFDSAWSTAKKHTTKGILLEQYFENGKEARYLVVDGKCVAIFERIPPSVRGDGTNTIGQLIDQTNEIKKKNPSRHNCLIKIDDHRLNILKSQGYFLDSIPSTNKIVIIDWKAGLTSGADARNITDDVHDSMKIIAEQIASKISGLDVLGVDILANNHSREATPNNYIIVEANTRPMITGHHFPDFGRPINVAKLIAESCLRKMGIGSPESSDSRITPEPSMFDLDDLAKAPTVSNFSLMKTAPLANLRHTKPSSSSITLVFGGDTSLGDAYLDKINAQEHTKRLIFSPFSFFEALMPLVSDKSHFFLNFESVLSKSPTGTLNGIKKYLGWDNPERTISTLKEIGVDTVSLANNHTMDFGPDKLIETMSHLRQAKINVIGAGQDINEASRPFKLVTNLGSIYILAGFEVRAKYRDDFNFYATKNSAGVNPFRQRESNQITKMIDSIRKKDPDSFIIIYPHWGGSANYQWATDRMFEVNSSFVTAGADLVLGHGAHMVQECEAKYAGTTVFSLGNFVFNSPGRYKKNNAPPYSLICRLQLQRNPHWTGIIELYPIVSDNRKTGYRPRPVQEAEAIELFDLLGMRSQLNFQKDFSLDMNERGWFMSRSFTKGTKYAHP